MLTFSKIYIHVVFSVKGRQKLIDPIWENDLFKYISGIIKNKNQKLLAINGTSNHIHILVNIKPSCSLSDLVREIKKSSNCFINDNKYSKFKFQWQEGFGAFSYSESQIDSVIKYINNQKIHHKRRSFKEELNLILNKFNIQKIPSNL